MAKQPVGMAKIRTLSAIHKRGSSTSQGLLQSLVSDVSNLLETSKTTASTTSTSSTKSRSITAISTHSSSTSRFSTSDPTSSPFLKSFQSAARSPSLTSEAFPTSAATQVPLGLAPIKEAAAIGIAFGIFALIVVLGLLGIYLFRRQQQGKSVLGTRFRRNNNRKSYPEVAWLYDPLPSSGQRAVSGASLPGGGASDNLIPKDPGAVSVEMSAMRTPPRRLSEVPTLREPTPDLPEFLKAGSRARSSSRGPSPAGFGGDLASARASIGGDGNWRRESADIKDEERAPLTSQGHAAGQQH